MTYNQIEIDACFDRIWPSWLNKTNPHAAKKALGVKLKMPGVRMDTIELACSIYVEEHRGQEFTYELNNFLIKDLYVDSLQGETDPEKYKALLEREKLDAISVINSWNACALPHWAKVLDIEERIPIAKKALTNDFFKKNWKIALDKAVGIFKYKAREGTPYAKLILSFQWFCNVSPDKHTVLKILEGGFGQPEPDVLPKNKVETLWTEDDWKEVKELWAEAKAEAETTKEDDKRPDTTSTEDDSPW